MPDSDAFQTVAPPARRRRGRPAGADPAGQRKRILDVAALHFARLGFDGASLRVIAEEAGFGHSLIRHYFGSKDALWRATAAHLFDAVATAMAEGLTAGDDKVGRLEAQIRATVRMAARTPHLAGFVMQAGLAGGERFNHLIERHFRPVYEFALSPYRALRGNGKAALDPHFVYLIATNAAISPFAQAANTKALTGRDLFDPATADAYADTLIRVLMSGGLETPSTPAGEA